jgi:hypothetical protein
MLRLPTFVMAFLVLATAAQSMCISMCQEVQPACAAGEVCRCWFHSDGKMILIDIVIESNWLRSKLFLPDMLVRKHSNSGFLFRAAGVAARKSRLLKSLKQQRSTKGWS